MQLRLCAKARRKLPSASAKLADALNEGRQVIVRKGHKRPKTRLTFTAKTAGAGICASGGGSSGLWFDTQSTTATAALATSDCEESTCTAYCSGASDSEFVGDCLGVKPKVPKANEADFDDVIALEAAFDVN